MITKEQLLQDLNEMAKFKDASLNNILKPDIALINYHRFAGAMAYIQSKLEDMERQNDTGQNPGTPVNITPAV